MKEMSKKKIIDKKSVQSILSERNLLSKMNHPFIINMQFSFQNKENLYLGMDILKGGDMRYHICCKQKWSEKEIQFILCNLILALEYIHKNQIIHRDIKPENIVLAKNGYLKLTDFGIAHKVYSNNKMETSGTPGYMAPEVLYAMNHTVVADYFALGVIGYELMMGQRPYIGKSRKEIRDKVTSKQAKIKTNQIPSGYSIESADFINKLIIRKPTARLGYNGIQEIKNHPWIKFFNWKDLYLMKIAAPFKPNQNLEQNIDYNYCNMKEKIGVETEERYNKIGNSEEYKHVFESYTNFCRDKIEDNIENFVNPHQIYVELEEKEKIAFSNKIIDEEKEVKIEDVSSKFSPDDSSAYTKDTGISTKRNYNDKKIRK